MRTVVLRLEDDTGVYFESVPISNARLDIECPMFKQGESIPDPRPSLGERLRQVLPGKRR